MCFIFLLIDLLSKDMKFRIKKKPDPPKKGTANLHTA